MKQAEKPKTRRGQGGRVLPAAALPPDRLARGAGPRRRFAAPIWSSVGYPCAPFLSGPHRIDAPRTGQYAHTLQAGGASAGASEGSSRHRADDLSCPIAGRALRRVRGPAESGGHGSAPAIPVSKRPSTRLTDRRSRRGRACT
jgi:hypothetical protein